MDKFFNYKGYKVYYHSNGEAKKGKVFIVHGIGEHIERYNRIEEFLVNDGFLVEGVDLLGHGQTSGKRGDIPSFELQFEIFDEAINFYPNEKSYLLCHSLGGLIGIRYLEERKGLFKKAIVSSGIFYFDQSSLPKFLKIISDILFKISPSFTLDNRIDVNELSRNNEEIKKYVEDPLVHRKISIRLFKEILKNCEIVLSKTEDVPILILYGEFDKIVPPVSSKLLYESWKGEKIIKSYSMKHELFNDPEGDKVIKDILEFLNK
ncbi:MAG: lysophospholipase [Caldisericia bacterium]